MPQAVHVKHSSFSIKTTGKEYTTFQHYMRINKIIIIKLIAADSLNVGEIEVVCLEAI